MIVSPPLVITKDEIDTLAERAWASLDQAAARLKEDGLMKAAS
jgi:putrescine aminotransferase